MICKSALNLSNRILSRLPEANLSQYWTRLILLTKTVASWGSHCTLNQIYFSSTQSSLLPPIKEVCERNVFTGVCVSTGGSLSRRGSLSRGLCLGASVQRVSVREAPRMVKCGHHLYLNYFKNKLNFFL